MLKSTKNYLRFQRARRQLKGALKKDLRPRPEFFRAARKNFLVELEKEKLDGKENRRPARPAGHAWRFALVAIFLAFLVGGGVMALADEPGVGPGHWLYPIKRAGENIQLALASDQQKPFLHYQLAENRLDEIKILNDQISRAQTASENQNSSGAANSSSGSVDKKQKELGSLNQEFDAQIDAALKKIDQIDDKADNQDSNLSDSAKRTEKSLCQSIAATIKERNSVLSDFDIDYTKDLSTWQEYCGRYMNVSSNGISSPTNGCQ